MNNKEQQQGICPNCKSEDIDYSSLELGIGGNQIYYPMKCNNCNFEGKEWYKLTFMEITKD